MQYTKEFYLYRKLVKKNIDLYNNDINMEQPDFFIWVIIILMKRN